MVDRKQRKTSYVAWSRGLLLYGMIDAPNGMYFFLKYTKKSDGQMLEQRIKQKHQAELV